MQEIDCTIPLAYDRTPLRCGVLYLVYNKVFEKMAKQAGFKGRYHDYTIPNPWNGDPVESLLLIGGGGFGDRIQMTPGLKRLAAKAGCPVDVANSLNGMEWYGLDYVGNILTGLVTTAQAENYEAVITLEGVIQDPEANEIPMHQLLAKWFKVKVRKKTKPEYVILPGEERMVYLPPKRLPRVGIHFGHQSKARIWPTENWLEVIYNLMDDCEVVLLGRPDEGPTWEVTVHGTHYLTPPLSDRIIDYCGHTADLRTLAVAINTCDAFISADSGPLHMAGALDVPTVGLYGPFPYEIRGVNLPSITPIQVSPPHEECSCYPHVQGNTPLPCSRDYCDMMVGIQADDVIKTVRGLLK